MRIDHDALHDHELELLAAPEGLMAFRVLLPLLRAVAMAIAGVAPLPPAFDQLPEVKADVALERHNYRALKDRQR